MGLGTFPPDTDLAPSEVVPTARRSPLRKMILRGSPETSLEERALFLESVLETARDVILTADRSGVIRSCNRAVSDLFGFMPYEVVGKSLHELVTFPAPDADVVNVTLRLEGRRKNGEIFPASLKTAEISVCGETFISGVVRDITKILETERELERRTEELFLTNAQSERLAASAAFDLEVPLDVIAHFSPRLKGRLGDEMDRMIEDVSEATKAMQALIVDRLALSRFERDNSSGPGKD